MKKCILVLVLILAGCASPPRFRKAEQENEAGYRVKSTERNEVFEVTALVPGLSEKQRLDYLTRAVGEECLARSYLFFDLGPLGPSTVRGFCFKENRTPSLGVKFDLAAGLGKKPVLKVQETELNFHSPLHARDVIKKLGGKEVDTIGGLKSEILQLASKDHRNVGVLVERSEIELRLEATIRDVKNKLYDPIMLEEIRRSVP